MFFPFPSFVPVRQARIAFAGVTTDTSDAASYTFTDHAIGTASADRVVLVVIRAFDSVTYTFGTVTIGGNNATSLVDILHDVTSNRFSRVAIHALLVPTGTTATIVVPLATGAADRCSVSVHALTGTGGAVTAFDTVTDTATGTLSGLLDIPAGGAAIAGASFADTTAFSEGATWTGLTETADVNPENTNNLFSTAASSNMAEETGRTIQATNPLDSDLGSALAAASFAPA